MKNVILVSFILLSTISFSADSTRIDTSYHHNRKKAALFSAIMPGTGSIYNEFGHRKVQGRANISWWRAPIYWVGLGVTGYYAYSNGKEAKSLKTEWLNRQNTGLKVNYLEFENDDLINGIPNVLLGFRDRVKYRDYLIAGFVLVYALNVLDAFVDAHFVTFNVSQNLALSFHPKMYSPKDYGIGLTFNFN